VDDAQAVADRGDRGQVDRLRDWTCPDDPHAQHGPGSSQVTSDWRSCQLLLEADDHRVAIEPAVAGVGVQGERGRRALLGPEADRPVAEDDRLELERGEHVPRVALPPVRRAGPHALHLGDALLQRRERAARDRLAVVDEQQQDASGRQEVRRLAGGELAFGPVEQWAGGRRPDLNGT
jgi:hypothetical protein